VPKGEPIVGVGGRRILRLFPERIFSVHFDEAAERNGAHPPARACPVGPPEQLRAEADREDFDHDAAQPCDQIMAEFVHEDQNGQDDQERQDPIDDVVHGRHDGCWIA
jgi:hypothetical protein